MVRLFKVFAVLLLAVLAARGGAQQVGGVSFTTPPGWQLRVQEGMATFTPAGGPSGA